MARFELEPQYPEGVETMLVELTQNKSVEIAREPQQPRPGWRNQIACRGVQVDFFFPERGVQGPALDPIIRLCQYCPVLADCLEYSLKHPSHLAGIYAGLTGGDRRKLGRSRPTPTTTPLTPDDALI